MPIGVLGEIGVRVQQRAFLGFVEELAVCGGGRPVHQAAGFIGGIVKQVDADLLATIRATAGYSSSVISRAKGMIIRSRGCSGVCLWVE